MSLIKVCDWIIDSKCGDTGCTPFSGSDFCDEHYKLIVKMFPQINTHSTVMIANDENWVSDRTQEAASVIARYPGRQYKEIATYLYVGEQTARKAVLLAEEAGLVRRVVLKTHRGAPIAWYPV